MRVKCPSCGSITELQLPVLLAVCLCGSLVKGKFDGSSSAGAGTPQAATVDHYAVLGVDRNSTEAEIKAAHRRRVKETHPDIGGDAEEFKLVQAAYEVLGNPASRKRYDSGESIGSQQTLRIVTPDLIGKTVTEAVRLATESQLAARVAIVEVSNSSQLRGRVVGQMPYPGVESGGGVIGLLVAVPQASTLWQRFRAAATELATGFWVGLKSSTIGGTKRPAELGSGSSLHNAGAAAGEVVGAVAVGAVGVAIGAVSFAVRAMAIFGFIVLLMIGFLLLALAPPLGVCVLAFTGWLIYKAIKKSSS